MAGVVWYLHPYSGGPELGMAYRPYYLAQQFKQQGLKPWVISAAYHHLLRQPKLLKLPFVRDRVDGLDYLWLKTPSYEGNGVDRLRNMLAYGKGLKQQANNLINVTGVPQHIIVSSAHPFHFSVAYKLAKKYGAQLIFEVRDLWPLSLVQLAGVKPWHPLVWWLARLQRKAYKKSDIVVSLLANALPYMRKKGLNPERFYYIPNGIDTTLENNAAEFILPGQVTGKFLLGYAGAHGQPNALLQLLEAIKLLPKQLGEHIQVYLLGEGGEKPLLQGYAREQALDNVIFLPAVSQKQSIGFLHQMDALFLGWQNKPIYQYGISPNKLFEYMLAAKPILHAYSGENDIVQLAECGLTSPAQRPDLLAKNIETMVQLSDEQRLQLANSGQQYVKQQHCYARLANRYVDLFKQHGLST